MDVGMIIFRDSSDEVEIYLIMKDIFNKIKTLFDNMETGYVGIDKFMNEILPMLDDNVIERFFTQTYCYEDIDFSKYKIRGLLTFPVI